MQTLTTTVTVRYFAAARSAAGLDTEALEIAADASVGDVITAASARHGVALERVLQRCSFLLDEVAVRDRSAPVPDGATLDVLPPFAGG